ncbi:S8 family serine peptidase [Patescibacteria group bacterium]
MSTKKHTSVLIVTVCLAVLLGVLISSTLIAKNDTHSDKVKRVLIKPNDAKSELTIRQNKDVEVMHEFDGKFSANIPEDLSLDQYAEVEDVVVLEIANFESPKYCGDGLIQASEQCGETGLPQCSEGKECNYCQCKNPNSNKAKERTCEPIDQIPYNVTQVNGGQIPSGDKIDVAVLDTGAFLDHIDLDNIKVCKDTTSNGMSNGCEDTIYHGTHTAGTVGANGGPDGLGIFGVAPNANIWAIKVCYSRYCNDDDIAEAINYAGKRGAEIVSMSFSSDVPAPLIEEAILSNPDVLFIASSGNYGYNGVLIGYPAAYKEVVAVGAIDQNKQVVSFSARGIDDGDDSTIVEKEVELVAGGRSVESAFSINGCYVRSSGTSMSAPTVSGLAAKVWQGDAESTRLYLRSIAEDITDAYGGGAGPGYDAASGYGLPVAP